MARVKPGPLIVTPLAVIVVVTPCFPLNVSQSAEDKNQFVVAEDVAIVRVRVFEEVEIESPVFPDVAKVKVGPDTPLMVVVVPLPAVPFEAAVILP